MDTVGVITFVSKINSNNFLEVPGNTWTYGLGNALIVGTLLFAACQGSVGERASSLEQTLGHVSSLHGDLNSLLEQLNDMRSKLKGHEPPRVLPADVEKQLKKLSVSQKKRKNW